MATTCRSKAGIGGIQVDLEGPDSPVHDRHPDLRVPSTVLVASSAPTRPTPMPWAWGERPRASNAASARPNITPNYFPRPIRHRMPLQRLSQTCRGYLDCFPSWCTACTWRPGHGQRRQAENPLEQRASSRRVKSEEALYSQLAVAELIKGSRVGKRARSEKPEVCGSHHRGSKPQCLHHQQFTPVSWPC